MIAVIAVVPVILTISPVALSRLTVEAEATSVAMVFIFAPSTTEVPALGTVHLSTDLTIVFL